MVGIEFCEGTIRLFYNLNKGKTSIGRSEKSDIVVNDAGKRVSREQMDVILDDEGNVFVLDKGSKNGTFVNGQLIGTYGKENAPYKLKDGDIVSFGSSVVPEKFVVKMTKHDYQASRVIEEKNADNQIKKQNIIAYNIESKLIPIKIIGKGGFGSTQLVEDEQGHKFVTKFSTKDGDVFKGRFKRECRNILQLSHPNIINAYAYRALNMNEEGSEACLVMEYAEEGTLKDYVEERGGKLPVSESIRIILQILDALKYLEDVEIVTEIKKGGLLKTRGLVHRDISPENIFSFNNHSLFKIGDFGLSKGKEEKGKTDDAIKTQPGEAYGKEKFISKLQYLRYADAVPFYDLWSCMAVLFYMLTGKTVRDSAEDMEKEPKEIRKAWGEDFEFQKRIGGNNIIKLVDYIDSILSEENKKANSNGEIVYTTPDEAEKELSSILKMIEEHEMYS